MKFPDSYDAAMLDLDGTMVDTSADFVEALGRMLQELRLPPVAADVVVTLVGKGGDYLVRGALLASGLEPARVDRLAEDALRRYRFHYEEVNGRQATVYPGVFEGLQRLRAHGLKLACVTNKPTAEARALLHAMGLDGYFTIVAGGDRFERIKPDAEPLLKTCEALGTRPGRTLMIGDSLNDALAARAAGCPVVLVTYGFNHGQPVRNVAADGYLDSIASLALA
jgi:2-phosphoglycolate phosphatase, prokaryotic